MQGRGENGSTGQGGMSKTAFAVILIIYCIYAGIFIYRTSFVIDGERYFSLFDDAMISMRYAKNLAEGHGLVWNAGGERVEGYTNLLWTLWMALLHLIPVAQSKMSLLVQISSAVLLLINLIFVRKIAEAVSDRSWFVSMGAVLVTGFYLPLNNWSLQGMEVGLLALLISICLWKCVGSLKSGRFSYWIHLTLAASILVRLDMAVPFIVIVGLLVVVDRPNRMRNVLWGGILLVGLVGCLTLFRLWYYGEALPNTYYLKLTGYPSILRITRGLYVTMVFIWRANWILLLIPFFVVRLVQQRVVWMLLGVFAGQLLYNVYVGGDAWEPWGGSNRYVSIAMPAFFVLVFCCLREIGNRLRSYVRTEKPDAVWMDAYAGRVRIGVLVAALLSFNMFGDPATITELLLLRTTLHVEKNAKMVERGLALAGVTTKGAEAAVVWDGAISYFSDRNTVSILGKNDRWVARRKMKTYSGPQKLVAFYPGHMKWDYAYSIGHLRPDVVVQLGWEKEKAAPHLYRDYIPAEVGEYTFYLLRGSREILWDQVPTMPPAQ
jgi:hypothetical protein